MSIQSKIQALITAANAKTGETDATLTDAVQTLVDGYGGITPSGNIDITSMAQVDVTNYATAQVVDADLIASNIKKDVNILGVVGSFEGGGATIYTGTTSPATTAVYDVTHNLNLTNGYMVYVKADDNTITDIENGKYDDTGATLQILAYGGVFHANVGNYSGISNNLTNVVIARNTSRATVATTSSNITCDKDRFKLRWGVVGGTYKYWIIPLDEVIL